MMRLGIAAATLIISNLSQNVGIIHVHPAPGLADAATQDLGSLSGEMADWESSQTDKRLERQNYAFRTRIRII
jgi:hypothetical protein